MSSIQHSEMGLSLMTPFRAPSHALPTPPSSPQALSKSLKRQASRFRLTHLLKRTQPVDSAACAPTETILRTECSSSRGFKCSEQLEPSISEFRRIHEIKQPFPLVLPITPTSTAKEESLTRTTSRKLRKMPKCYRNLRAHMCDNQLSSHPPKPLVKTPALLPSPLPSDSEEGHSRNGYFTFQKPRVPRNTHAKSAETSYDYQDIVAGYCEDVFEENSRDSESTRVIAADRGRIPPSPSQQQDNTHTSAVTRTAPTSNMSAALRSPKRDRSSSLSSEATWLSKSFSNQDHSTFIGQLESIKMNEKRLAEKSRRCCHLVQGPHDDLPAFWTGERKAVR